MSRELRLEKTDLSNSGVDDEVYLWDADVLLQVQQTEFQLGDLLLHRLNHLIVLSV